MIITFGGKVSAGDAGPGRVPVHKYFGYFPPGGKKEGEKTVGAGFQRGLSVQKKEKKIMLGRLKKKGKEEL